MGAKAPRSEEEQMNAKIEAAKVYQEDLREYFGKCKDTFDSQKQMYWSKKIEQLDKKVQALPA